MANILIVDDAGIIRCILRAMIEKLGHRVVGEAPDGSEALRLFRELKPDLVTLDIMMANGDGLSYLKQIIHMDPDARVIMVTALAQDTKEEEARQSGALGYVTKPFQASKLNHAIDTALVN